MAQCGSCSVIIGGRVVRSCVMPVSAVGQEEVTTLEGLGTPEKPHPLQQAFIDEGAAQCGFCLSGVILTAKAALDENPRATDEEISQALGCVMCRCFVHVRMMRAIRKYAETPTLIAQHEKQRRRRIDVDHVRLAIHIEIYRTHRSLAAAVGCAAKALGVLRMQVLLGGV